MSSFGSCLLIRIGYRTAAAAASARARRIANQEKKFCNIILSSSVGRSSSHILENRFPFTRIPTVFDCLTLRSPGRRRERSSQVWAREGSMKHFSTTNKTRNQKIFRFFYCLGYIISLASPLLVLPLSRRKKYSKFHKRKKPAPERDVESKRRAGNEEKVRRSDSLHEWRIRCCAPSFCVTAVAPAQSDWTGAETRLEWSVSRQQLRFLWGVYDALVVVLFFIPLNITCV